MSPALLCSSKGKGAGISLLLLSKIVIFEIPSVKNHPFSFAVLLHRIMRIV